MPPKSLKLIPDDSTQVAQYMRNLVHPMKSVMEELRSIIKAVHPEIQERIKWNAPSYHYKGVDFLTFGTPARKQDEILLVFHHPLIVSISSELLRGNFKDRRLVVMKDKEEVQEYAAELKGIIENLLHQMKQS